MTDEITICRARRRALGITTAVFCKRVNIWPADVYQIERREIKAGPSRRKRLADVLGLPEDELFEETGYAKFQDPQR